MYVCIIMEYYKLGDMDRVLKQKRRSKEHIEELVQTSMQSYPCALFVAYYNNTTYVYFSY